MKKFIPAKPANLKRPEGIKPPPRTSNGPKKSPPSRSPEKGGYPTTPPMHLEAFDGLFDAPSKDL